MIYVTVSSASCDDLATPAHAAECRKTGADQHSVAFILLGLLILALTLLAVRRRARGPAGAVLVVGLIVLSVTLLDDLPQSTEQGAIGSDYTSARAHRGTGFWLELAGGILTLGAAAAAYPPRRT